MAFTLSVRAREASSEKLLPADVTRRRGSRVTLASCEMTARASTLASPFRAAFARMLATASSEMSRASIESHFGASASAKPP